MSADGLGFNDIRLRLDCDVRFIQQCRERFKTSCMAGLSNLPTGRPIKTIDSRLEARGLHSTTSRQPADGSTHWSTCKLALELGGVISHNAVAQIWRAHGLKPHRLEGYMARIDPQFEQKAAEFCVDEKAAIQALGCKDLVLPLSPGRDERHGFEYKRHATLLLYAAFATQTGQVIGKTTQRHTSSEFVAFLGEIVDSQSAKREIHVIADNLAAHKTQKMTDFLAQHPTVHLHYTPTYSN